VKKNKIIKRIEFFEIEIVTVFEFERRVGKWQRNCAIEGGKLKVVENWKGLWELESNWIDE
jgi:hypothetical protein